MKHLVAISLACILGSPAVHAGWIGGAKVNRIRTLNNVVYISTIPQPANTCSNYGEFLKLDLAPSTPDNSLEKKTMLSILMAAKMSDRPVELWYSEAAVSGTEPGCSDSTMGVLVGASMPASY